MEHMVEGSMSTTGRGCMPPPVVWGSNGESRIIVCSGCNRDIPIRGVTWRQCGCPAFKCEQCASRQCGRCNRVARGARDDLLFDDPHGPAADTGGDEVVENDGENWDFHHCAQFAWDITGEAPDQPHSDDSVLSCASCSVRSREHHGGWRICRCGYSYCVDCASWGCSACGESVGHGAAVVRRVPTDQVATDSNANLGVVSEGEQALAMPQILTPYEALQRRRRILEEHDRTLTADRKRNRDVVKWQIAQGLRPRRPRNASSTVSFASVNVTTPMRLKEELMRGGANSPPATSSQRRRSAFRGRWWATPRTGCARASGRVSLIRHINRMRDTAAARP